MSIVHKVCAHGKSNVPDRKSLQRFWSGKICTSKKTTPEQLASRLERKIASLFKQLKFSLPEKAMNRYGKTPKQESSWEKIADKDAYGERLYQTRQDYMNEMDNVLEGLSMLGYSNQDIKK